MKTAALLHTVMSVASTFGSQLKEYMGGDIKIYNIWDDFLAINPNEIGEFTTVNKNRLLQDIKTAEQTGADVIVVTCSTLTPHMPYIRPYISVPVIAIDDAMTIKAAEIGGKILVVATARSTIQGTTDKVLEDAAKLGKTVEVDQMVLSDAFAAMQAGDMAKHNELLIGAVKDVKGYDCVVLAQASMAPCAKEIESYIGVPVLGSPALCMESVKACLEGID